MCPRRRRKIAHLFFATIVVYYCQEIAAFPTKFPPVPELRQHRGWQWSAALCQSLGDGDGNLDDDDNNNNKDTPQVVLKQAASQLTSNFQRSLLFSIGMTLAGATLGPFLDTYHSAFGVLHYEHPITAALWSSAEEHPALITAWWVPELFGLAGFLIGWLYIALDAGLSPSSIRPSVPKILGGISLFTFQYWFSGVLVAMGVDRVTILNIMSTMAAMGFVALDGTLAGLVTSTATALGGPLIEICLLSLSQAGMLGENGYAYTDLGETGFFPLWICPVYFLGGPANGNLARGLWNAISDRLGIPAEVPSSTVVDCKVCRNTRTVPCPNCDGTGDYIAMGGRRISCTACRGRGFVICRDCFTTYGDDPYDIEAIREKMSRMPD
ncbi:hypothetical protein FisN_8Lh083 [Fistulifera solaris]|uniref:Uncharacterized protein n=1 Tax=Fistulifera solaris TaxID=1519565 RepID=A0A1Z5JDD9_FISSO|nr:hypothetical protein FisN_8Lh083 [Fistulifera solaris]|eukprot:GAX11989.1 hypothetical protein FisN_8Lh083 [Fistulifera solaris]